MSSYDHVFYGDVPLDGPEPEPRGSAEWYAWAVKNPVCCECSGREMVGYVQYKDAGGYLCVKCLPRAREIFDSIVE